MNYIDVLTERYPALEPLKDKITAATEMLIKCYREGGKVLLCGNGGSAADCEHVAGELLKGFILKREPCGEELEALTGAVGEDAVKLQRGIPAIPLPSISGAISAFANDVEPSLVFAQTVYALGKKGDLLIAFSTSGNSKNVVSAVKVAKALGINTLSFTGIGGGMLSEISDITLRAPEKETYKIQEYHLPIYHAICAEAERILFS